MIIYKFDVSHSLLVAFHYEVSKTRHEFRPTTYNATIFLIEYHLDYVIIYHDVTSNKFNHMCIASRKNKLERYTRNKHDTKKLNKHHALVIK